ncbi:uncharacterized protein TrAtP1_007226 [Trichoderma atroviride]|uniref:uncharacterized protein n=1 Tax=Hypocrea atroviridis TaxID=63577 RepID=UPI003316856C|nr:hypothetical protein TrAtP1_007226 [Trichoderma atroviride]
MPLWLSTLSHPSRIASQMVGVAGRSKACTTCKLRHVRCDARRPSCLCCEAGAITCLGYERPTVFIDQTNQIREMVTKPPSKIVKPQLAISHISEFDGVRVPSSVSIYHFHFRPLGVDFGDSFERQASRYDDVRAFMDKILLRHYTKLSCGSNRENPADLAVIPMLGTSAESVALYMCGKLAPNLTQVHQAFMLHGQTLDQLRAVISLQYHTNWQSVTASAPLLVVIMNMILYEWIAPTTQSAWKDHVHGLEALINNYGPAVFHQEPMKQVFEQARMHIVVAHLDDVQPTFLEEPAWQEVPWCDQPKAKSIVNYYIDILCCIPGLLEKKNRLSRGLDVDPDALRRSITRQIFRLYTKLLQVRWLWEVSNPSCCWEIPAGEKHPGTALPIETTAGQPLFESLLFFSSFQRAIETNLYNCCILFLCYMAFQLESLDELKQLPTSHLFGSSHSVSNLHRFSDSDTKCAKTTGHSIGITCSPYAHKTNPALAFPNELSTWNLAGYEICRSIEFMLQPNHGPAGAYFAMFPLRVAQLFIGPWSKNESGPKLNLFLQGQFTATMSAPGPISNETKEGSDVIHATAFRPTREFDNGNRKTKGNIKEKNDSALVSQWIRSIMGYIADVYGFSVTRSFN